MLRYRSICQLVTTLRQDYKIAALRVTLASLDGSIETLHLCRRRLQTQRGRLESLSMPALDVAHQHDRMLESLYRTADILDAIRQNVLAGLRREAAL